MTSDEVLSTIRRVEAIWKRWKPTDEELREWGRTLRPLPYSAVDAAIDRARVELEWPPQHNWLMAAVDRYAAAVAALLQPRSRRRWAIPEIPDKLPAEVFKRNLAEARRQLALASTAPDRRVA